MTWPCGSTVISGLKDDTVSFLLSLLICLFFIEFLAELGDKRRGGRFDPLPSWHTDKQTPNWRGLNVNFYPNLFLNLHPHPSLSSFPPLCLSLSLFFFFSLFAGVGAGVSLGCLFACFIFSDSSYPGFLLFSFHVSFHVICLKYVIEQMSPTYSPKQQHDRPYYWECDARVGD